MTKRTLLALSVVVALASCVKEITSDERLERETRRSDALTSTTAGELAKLKCDDVAAELAKARDERASEEGRLKSYVELYDRLRNRASRFEEAMTRNPDLAYQEGSGELTAARDTCIQATADVKLELETLVREIMQMPTVEEIKGGSTVKVARMSFESLRQAIETLEPDDKDSLLQKVNNAEKSLENSGGKRKRER